MFNTWRVSLVFFSLLAGVLLVACGGGGNGSGDSTDEPPAGDATTDTSDAGASDGDTDADLRGFAERFGQREVKIEYDFSSSSGGETTDAGSITLYWKPPDAWRMDIATSSGDVSLITNADGSFLCAEGQCLLSPTDGVLPIPFLSLFTEPESLADLIDTSLGDFEVERSQRTVAGRDASCFSAAGVIEGEAGSAEYCFDDGGLLLLLRGGATGETFSLEATEVSDSVDDSDLEPPFDVLDLGDLIP